MGNVGSGQSTQKMTQDLLTRAALENETQLLFRNLLPLLQEELPPSLFVDRMGVGDNPIKIKNHCSEHSGTL